MPNVDGARTVGDPYYIYKNNFGVNLGVGPQTYEDLLGPAPRQAAGYEVIDNGVDYTAADVVLPHPLYAPMHWVCNRQPGRAERSQLAHLIEIAHALAMRQYDNLRRR